LHSLKVIEKQKNNDLEGKLFKKFDMKGFSIDDKDKALEFLKNSE